MIRLSLVALALVVVVAGAVAAGCGDGGDETSAPPPPPPRTEPTTATAGRRTGPPPASVAIPAALTEFGSYASVPASDPDAPRYAGPAQPTSMTGVRVAPELREDLAAPGVRDALLARGFVVVPSDLRLLHFAYQGAEYGGWPVFVTTDAAYHTWHLAFDKVLRDLEQRVLLPKLTTLVSGLVRSSRAQAAALAGTSLEDDAGRVEQLMQVAAAELGVPVALGPLAAREKALVDAHSTTEVSPILGTKIDYSVFTPRGHYTRNASLRRYFVAMSVLGQSAFCMPGTRDCPGLEPARMAILAARSLNDRADLVALWREIYEPTAFLVGFSDDYTPLELIQAVRGAAPEALDDASALARDANVEAVVARLAASRSVRINPDRASVRLMGARFVIDSFILDQLLFPNVGSSDEPRLLPSGLDVPAAFGSEFAYRALKDAGATAYANYDERLADLQAAVARRPEKDWGSTVYDAWLYALQPVFARHGAAFPAFMGGEAWAAKGHQTGLASYAELKHDTLLYAKQAVAEGGGLDEPPARRNWVEPEPVAFARLAAAAELLRSGLAERKLLGGESGTLLRETTELLDFFARIARDELAGTPIAARDNDRLTGVGGALEVIFWRASDRAADGAPTIDQDAAIVADIASGPPGVLEVATGRFDRILVLVPDDTGRFQVAAGGVYSYYEFTSPPGERLDDGAWRAKLDAGSAPPRPSWEDAMLAK